MNNLKRLTELLDKCVFHIMDFEEDEARNVLSDLGFTDEELKEYGIEVE